MPVGSFFFNYPPTFLLTPHPPTHPWVAWRYILVLPGVLHTTTPQAIYFTCRNYNSYEPSSFFLFLAFLFFRLGAHTFFHHSFFFRLTFPPGVSSRPQGNSEEEATRRRRGMMTLVGGKLPRTHKNVMTFFFKRIFFFFFRLLSARNCFVFMVAFHSAFITFLKWNFLGGGGGGIIFFACWRRRSSGWRAPRTFLVFRNFFFKVQSTNSWCHPPRKNI